MPSFAEGVEAVGALRRISTALTRLPPKPRWIPCSERLPNEGDPVFFVVDGDVMDGDFEAGIDGGVGWWNYSDGYWTTPRVSHWMPRYVQPIPDPPAKDPA